MILIAAYKPRQKPTEEKMIRTVKCIKITMDLQRRWNEDDYLKGIVEINYSLLIRWNWI